MATHTPMARVPFAPLDNPRLQHLASLKNRQSGLLAQKSASLGKAGTTKSVLSPPKRSYDSTRFDDVDGENIDPATLSSPAKKSKSDVFGTASAKGFTFAVPSTRSMPAPSAQPLRFGTPTRPTVMSSRATLTAPAGRSPKRKTTQGRRISAPFSRIDPPSSLGARAGSMLPFSLDAAIHGTLSSGATPKSSSSTIQESMPSGWFFDIYEDSPEEVAANLMEHSTSTLDISSDEESAKKERNDRGKENMPPEDYDGPTASRSPTEPNAVPQRIKKSDIVRKRILVSDEMDDGQRSPLSDLETDFFIPAGLDKDAHFVVDAVAEQPATKLDLEDVFSTPVPFVAGGNTDAAPNKLESLPVVNDKGNVSGEVIVWQDDASAAAETPAEGRDVSGESNERATEREREDTMA